MFDPRPYLEGVFDAVMNYRWYLPTRGFFSQAPPDLTPAKYVAHLDSIESEIPDQQVRSMMNLTASHDSPRFATSIFNPGPYKYGVNPRDNQDYKLGRPDENTLPIRKQILVQQFTYRGAPHIWNGDEVGMWGADDPDCRKPLLWAELTYKPERADPFNRERSPEIVEADQELLDFYKRLTNLRQTYIELFAEGSLEYLLTDDERKLLAYQIQHTSGRALVLFSVSGSAHEIILPVANPATFVPVLETVKGSYRASADTLYATVPSRQAAVLIAR
jgi:glycosidase